MQHRVQPTRRASALALWALAAAATPAFAGESAQRFDVSGRAYVRAEAQANTFTASSQEAVTLARDAAGRTLVVWQSRKQEDGNYGLYAQRFGADGAKLGAETHLNQFTRGAQTRPATALDASGGAVVAWGCDGQAGSVRGVAGRPFDPQSHALGEAADPGHRPQLCQRLFARPVLVQRQGQQAAQVVVVAFGHLREAQ